MGRDRAFVDLVASILRRRMVQFLALSCLVLVPWTIGLALTLPRSYLVENWPLAWTGFDVILLGCLSLAAWSLWKQRQLAVPAAMFASVLLLCDAWFDIFTAHGGRCLVISVGTAMFAELPLAVLLGLTSIRLFRASLDAALDTPSTARPQPPLAGTPPGIYGRRTRARAGGRSGGPWGARGTGRSNSLPANGKTAEPHQTDRKERQGSDGHQEIRVSMGPTG